VGVIEKRLPLEIPPGLVLNGTVKERKGRWMDGNLIRFPAPEGHPRPVGGWQQIIPDLAIPVGEPRGMHTFFDTNGNTDRVFVSVVGSLYEIIPNSSTAQLKNITPVGYPSMSSQAASFDNLGDDLFFMAGAPSGSKLFRWNVINGVASLAAEVTQFTTQHGAGTGVVVTPESFLAVLKTGATFAQVVWADQATGYTTWLPSSTNTAGSLNIPTTGRLTRGIVVGSETLLLTTTDAWALRYVGGDLIYGVQQVGDSCGILAQNSAVTVGNVVYWMGENGFFQYDGYVRELQCEISEQIFGDMSRTNRFKFFTVSLPNQNEIWWFYATTASSTPNRVAIYNYATQAWSFIDTLQRSAGTHGVIQGFGSGSKPANNSFPYMADASGNLWAHEVESIFPPGGGVFVESGPVKLGDGDRRMNVQKLIPTVTTVVSNEADPADVRFSARQVRYKHTMTSVNSRVGVPELGVIPSSPR
jgi:hypothetical protein